MLGIQECLRFCLFAVVVSVIYFFYNQVRLRWYFRNFPQPPGLPIIGNLKDINVDPGKYTTGYVLEYKFN